MPPARPALHVSTRLFAASAYALLHFRSCGSFQLASTLPTLAAPLDVQRRIAQERVPSISQHHSNPQ